MPPPLHLAPEIISQLVNLLREKRFDETVEISRTMTDYPEACVLHCLAQVGGGKLFKANGALKNWIEAINDNGFFERLAKQAGFDCDDVYARSAPHDLGFLMWAAIESHSLSAGSHPEALLPYKMQLLHPSKGLSQLQQTRIMEELMSFDPGPEKLLQLISTPVPFNMYKYGTYLTAYIIGSIGKLAEMEDKLPNVPILMSTITLLMQLGPAVSELASQLLGKVFRIAPDEKMVIVSTYLHLAEVDRYTFQEKYVYEALNLINSLPEFVDDHQLTLVMKWHRLIRYYNYYSKMEWYRSNQAFELAKAMFFAQPLHISFDALLELTNTSNLEHSNTRLFLESLYGSLVETGRHHVEPLLPVIIGTREVWTREPLPKFLLLLGTLPGAGYIKDYVENYQKQQQELQRQQQLVSRMKGENFDRDPSIGGFISEYEVDRSQERVLLGVSTPQSVPKATGFTARFVAYEEWMEQEVKEKILQMSARSTANLGVKKCYWQRGTEITVCLTGDYVTVDNPEEKFIWDGEMNIIDFDVQVSAEVSAMTTTILKFNILIAGIVVGRIRVDLLITDSVAASPRQTITATPYRYAFASYASEDRGRVLDRVAEINRNGVDVFLDCLSIRPGEKWKPVLEREILKSSSFLLFWSVHAKQSAMVSWEWHTALRLKGINGIEPHPLDPVEEASPPEELQELHFGDVYMLVRKGTER